MPQVIALMVAGAGIYAGFKWVSRLLTEAEQVMKRGEEIQRQEAQARNVPKDLGSLELDPQTGVYRPRTKQHGG
ncbi:MAG TPA: hypothetical protein VEA77_06575 [Hyphomicrobium sp.]|nr:hypothetical protein [Hyphomicrobium sp.]